MARWGLAASSIIDTGGELRPFGEKLGDFDSTERLVLGENRGGRVGTADGKRVGFDLSRG